jgi:protein TonB
MGRRLFDDLVVSGAGTSRAPSWRTLPLSLALHAVALAALAALSITAVSEAPVRAAPVMLPPFARPGPRARPPLVRNGTPSRPVRVGQQPVVLSDPLPAVVANTPASDTDLGNVDTVLGDVPVCLTGCTPGGPGGSDAPGAGGPGGPGDGPVPPRRPGGEIREPRRIGGPLPVYPELARRAHVEGKVVLECVIDTEGRVTDLTLISGHPLLTGAALDAVRRWVYSPTTLNGQPIRVVMTVTVKFGLERAED